MVSLYFASSDFNPPTPCGVGPGDFQLIFWRWLHFNPPTPCGVGLPCCFRLGIFYCISIHPPRAGWDEVTAAYKKYNGKFQSTHPVRGGTYGSVFVSYGQPYFNPPTPCGVGPRYPNICTTNNHFNPPTPCGVGRTFFHPLVALAVFQSTHPVRGGTIAHAGTAFGTGFQSTHPVRGGTTPSGAKLIIIRNFNPPTPCGVGPWWLSRSA